VPEAHVPHLDDHDEEHADAPAVAANPPRRWTTLPKLLLEVILITTGVFLGLLGEQWRENSEQRELAHTALELFHAEFVHNRQEVARVHQRHQEQIQALRDYMRTNVAGLVAHLKDHTKPIPTPIPDTVTDSAGVEFSAWDVALATASLAHIDPKLVADMSGAYNMQQIYVNAHRAIQQTAYNISDPVYYLNGVTTWLDDSVLYERLLNERYDVLIPKLEKALQAR
jgi:hypothetical protein